MSPPTFHAFTFGDNKTYIVSECGTYAIAVHNKRFLKRRPDGLLRINGSTQHPRDLFSLNASSLVDNHYVNPRRMWWRFSLLWCFLLMTVAALYIRGLPPVPPFPKKLTADYIETLYHYYTTLLRQQWTPPASTL
jgi:hypothetical protein